MAYKHSYAWEGWAQGLLEKVLRLPGFEEEEGHG